jgi:hypothetical protein
MSFVPGPCHDYWKSFTIYQIPKAADLIHPREPIVPKKYRPGDMVPESGIYRVTHDSHRLMHEATLLQDQRFPLCRKCKHDVRFELRRAVKNPTRITSGYHAVLEDYPDVEPFIVN